MSSLRPVLLACLLAVAASGAAAQDQRPPAQVEVMTVSAGDVVLTDTLPGRIVASAVAEVRPQVNGIIVERLFDEGGRVYVGDVLYRIDAATYDAAVAQAEAGLVRARAAFEAARKEEERVQELFDRRVGTQQALDQAIADRDVAGAAISVAEAELQARRIEQARTEIRAPLAGEIGLAMATQGALVTASQPDPLAVIRSIDTVYVDVTQSADAILRWQRRNRDREIGEDERTVTLTLPDGEVYDHTGSVTAAEPQVDPQTGVVVLRIEFPNPDRLLLPGMYVRVDVQTEVLGNAFVVPQEAVGRDRRGRPTTLVVDGDGTVEERLVEVARARGTDWVVSGGLETGERIVVRGQLNAAPGSVVAPVEMAEAGASGPADAATGD